MSDMHLGFFEEFKGADTVLLSCSRAGLTRLASVLAMACSGPQCLHEMADVSARHSVRLFAAANDMSEKGFTWLVDDANLGDIQAMLQALASGPAGHQYFELAGSSARLIVSFNEYDDGWWAHT